MVVYAGDNPVVKHWLQSRKAKVRAGRILIRVVNMLEIRFGFNLLPGWWRTFHNVDADYLTRCSDAEYNAWLEKKGWTEVSVDGALQQALEDSEHFGPCFLAWGTEEDRGQMLQLKVRRQYRQLQKEVRIPWEKIAVTEWTAAGRVVKDFEHSAGALGALVEEQGSHAPLIVCAIVGVDRYGTGIKRVLALGQARDAWVVVVEGPVESSWETAENYCVKHGWVIYTGDFATTEFGEAMAQRRRFALIGLRGPLTGEPHKTVVKALAATPASLVLSEVERALEGRARLWYPSWADATSRCGPLLGDAGGRKEDPLCCRGTSALALCPRWRMGGRAAYGL